jgi:hypothetical protein
MPSQAHRDIRPKEHIMATQTRRPTPQPPVQASVLKVKTHVKAGSIIVHDIEAQKQWLPAN